jgi:hypothetical protein
VRGSAAIDGDGRRWHGKRRRTQAAAAHMPSEEEEGGAHRACGLMRRSGKWPVMGRGGGATRGGNGDGGLAAFREREPADGGCKDMGNAIVWLGGWENA